MPHPRQFTLMTAGDTVQNYSRQGEWQVVNVADFLGAGCCYYMTAQLDLRGLLAGDETGIEVSAVIPQEAAPWQCTTTEFTGWFYTLDILTTVHPTEESIASWYKQPSLASEMAGFLTPLDAPDRPPPSQDFNPSQVLWGMWRWWVSDRGVAAGTEAVAKAMQQGFLGEGETIVAPALYWTRVIVTMASGDAIVIPSSNLIVRGMAVDLSTAQEITQMMRASQR